MDFTKEEIIERFFRGDKQRSSEGNGLGLAIVSTYVKALGGEFDIKSTVISLRPVWRCRFRQSRLHKNQRITK